MITDEQGREWLLQKLYDDGWRYCVCMTSGNIYLTDKKPERCVNGEVSIYDCGRTGCINGLKNTLFNKLKRNEVLDIAEELYIVDWSEVEIDARVFVRNTNTEPWKCRYFAEYNNGIVYTWVDGRTSWSNRISDEPISWKYAKLAEV